MRHVSRFLLALALLSPGLALAQPAPALSQRSLDELMTIPVDTVSSAAKREQLVTEAPSSVTIVTAAEIATYGWRTLADALRATRGFYVTYDRNYTYLGVRGFGRPTDYNNRILLLVDGHRLNDNVYDSMGIGSDFPIDMALVERIEIIRGPGSALYGTNAFFAVVNVMTRRGDGMTGVEGALESASLGTWRARGSYGASNGSGRDLLLSVTHMTSAGATLLRFPEYDDPESGPGISRGADGDRATSVFASARVRGLSFESAHLDRTKHLPTGAWDTALSDPRTQTIDNRSWIAATWRGQARATELTARAAYDRLHYEGVYALGDDVVSERSKGDWLGGEVTMTRALTARHRLTAGSEFRQHLRQLQTIDRGDGPVDDSRRSRQFGLYAQDEVRLTRILTATVGVRADFWTLDGWSAHPRLALIARPDADTSLKLLYGSAYRAPNAYERYYVQGMHLANPELRPESLRTGEFVAERYVKGGLRLSAALYVTRIRRLISQYEHDGFLRHDNGAQVRAHGAEFEAERRWTSGVVMRGSLALQRTHEQETLAALSNSPGRLGTFRLETPLWSRAATLAADWQYVSARWTPRDATAGAYALTHLTWRYAPRTLKGSVSASVYNLFDTAYAHPVGAEFRQDVLLQDGRTLSVRATFGF